MDSLRIALIQQDSPVRQKDRNLDSAARWIAKAAKAGARLVCLPELNITGHAGHSSMVEQAEPVPAGPAVEELARLARKLDLYICAGIAEDDRGIHYNTQFLVGPNGYIGKQRKVHLSGDEYFLFRHGSDLPVFDLPSAGLESSSATTTISPRSRAAWPSKAPSCFCALTQRGLGAGPSRPRRGERPSRSTSSNGA